jgi:hypothetical protein
MSTKGASAKWSLEEHDAPPAKCPRGPPRTDPSAHTATPKAPEATTRKEADAASYQVTKATGIMKPGQGRPKGPTSVAKSIKPTQDVEEGGQNIPKAGPLLPKLLLRLVVVEVDRMIAPLRRHLR